MKRAHQKKITSIYNLKKKMDNYSSKKNKKILIEIAIEKEYLAYQKKSIDLIASLSLLFFDIGDYQVKFD